MTHEPIQENWLDKRDLFGIEYKEGIIFLEVMEIEDTQFDEFSQLEDIEGGTSLDSGFQKLEDSSSDDVLYVPPENENTVLHVGIGISPSQIEMFPAYPEGQRNDASIPNVESQAIPGTSVGGIDGSDSPYNNPTTETELMIPPKQHVEFDFENKGSDSHEPALNILYRKYKVRVLNPSNSGDTNAINRIASPGAPMPIQPVGNMTVKASYNMNKEWGVSPISLSRARRV